MPRQDFDLLNRYGQIRASELRRVEDALGRTGQMLPNGAGLDTSFAQVAVPGGDAAPTGDSLILARILANDGDPSVTRYSWVEIHRQYFNLFDGGQKGIFNAREINNLPVATDTIVFLVPDGGGGYLMDAGGSTGQINVSLGCDGDQILFATLTYWNGRLVRVQ